MKRRVLLDLRRRLPRQGGLQLGHDVAPQVLDNVLQGFRSEGPEVVLVLATGTRHHHARLLAHAKRVLLDVVLYGLFYFTFSTSQKKSSIMSSYPQFPEEPCLLPFPDRRVRLEGVRPLPLLRARYGRSGCHPRGACRGQLRRNCRRHRQGRRQGQPWQVSLPDRE